MAQTVEDQCEAMMAQLNALAPVLAPVVKPRGYEDNNLHAFASDSKHYKQATRKRVGECKKCQICSASASPFRVTSFWNLDFRKRIRTLQKARLLCPMCFQCTQTNHILQQSVSADTSEVVPLVKHFLRVNGQPDDNVHLFQQVYNLAYGVQVLASNIPGDWRIELPTGVVKNWNPVEFESLIAKALSLDG